MKWRYTDQTKNGRQRYARHFGVRSAGRQGPGVAIEWRLLPKCGMRAAGVL
ncbi:MAG TPA: hypothetical protein VIX89_07570 [Bryobacteraceae bacterium]